MAALQPQGGKYKEFYEEMVRKEESGGKSQEGEARPPSSKARGGRGRGAGRAGRR